MRSPRLLFSFQIPYFPSSIPCRSFYRLALVSFLMPKCHRKLCMGCFALRAGRLLAHVVRN